jgi:ribonuclease J
MKPPYFRIKPVGGVGQIGSNMTLVQTSQDTILIDAGILFPYEDFFDINYLIPNMDEIPEPTHLVITHGHEDHIGAVIHVIEKFPKIKVLASPFAAALIRKKCEFNKKPFPVTEYRHFDQLGFNQLTIDPIHVNHSIPETYGLLIKDISETFSLFFISDFKIDFKTIYERPFDFEKLERVTKKVSQKILLCDSTNIMSKTEQTPSEMDLIAPLDEIFKNAENRIFITCFSSNIHRLMTFVSLCKKYNKKLIPHGRSMISYLNTANELGMIPEFNEVIKAAESINPTQENIVVLLSGCQGDFRGTFRRFCIGEDSQFKPIKTDTVILSSKAIPGNEKKISLLLNKLAEANCKIVTSSESMVHVSGHPGRLDLLELFNKYQPTKIIPIHGETYFLRSHVEFIKNLYPKAETHFILNNHDILIDEKGGMNFQQNENIDPILIHGKGIVIEKDKISERRKLACNGSVFLSLKLTSTRAKVEKYSFSLMGLPLSVSGQEEKFKKFLENQFIHLNFKDEEQAKEELRVIIRRHLDQILGYKPITTIHLL